MWVPHEFSIFWYGHLVGYIPEVSWACHAVTCSRTVPSPWAHTSASSTSLLSRQVWTGSRIYQGCPVDGFTYNKSFTVNVLHKGILLSMLYLQWRWAWHPVEECLQLLLWNDKIDSSTDSETAVNYTNFTRIHHLYFSLIAVGHYQLHHHYYFIHTCI